MTSKSRIILATILVGLFGMVVAFVMFKRPFSEQPQPRNQSGSKTTKFLKLYVNRDGIYEVSPDQYNFLLENTNDPDKVNLFLSNRKMSVPYWVEKRTGNIRFYGQAIDDKYSPENIYWLGATEITPGKETIPIERQADTAATPVSGEDLNSGSPIQTYMASLQLEENLVYNPLVEIGEHWLWMMIPAPQKKKIDFELSDVAPGEGRLQLAVWGSTEASENPDHHLVLSLNGQLLVDETWDGKGRKLINAKIPVGVLVSGHNQLEITMPGDTGVLADVVFLDSIQIDYPSVIVAKDDQLRLVSSGGRLELDGFSGPVDVFDISDPARPIQAASKHDPGKGYPSQAGHTYWIVGPSGYTRVEKTEEISLPIDLFDSENGADLIAVGPPDLLDPLKPLLGLRESQGLKTLAIPVETIYDQFNDGFPQPQAIRNFLQYAQTTWVDPPKYLLLVGDASFDPKGYQASEDANRVPTFFVNTLHGGETASDFGYSIPGAATWDDSLDISSDTIKIAVGRLPARTPGQVTRYVDKVLAYEGSTGEQDETGSWRKRILAIADSADSAFITDAKNFLGVIPGSYETELMTPGQGEVDVSRQIEQRLDKGVGLAFYFGHGSINMWGKDRLFSSQDVSALGNGDVLPLIINLTCLTGLFTHPTEESLTEAFLLQPEAGAIAVLAPTSLTLPEDQSYLSYGLADELFAKPNDRLGDILIRTQRRVLQENPGSSDVLKTFLLFGDPTLQINLQPD